MMKLTFSALLATVAFAQREAKVQHISFEEQMKNLSIPPSHHRYAEFEKNFQEAVKQIEQFNKEAAEHGKTIIHAVNAFTHLSDIEKTSYYKGLLKEDGQALRSHKNAEFVSDVSADTPSSFDWRESKTQVVTPVKNQGQCGSCWTFSTTGALEGQYAMAGKGLVSMSEQMIVDCDSEELGCDGGMPTRAFDWLKNNPVCKESAWPYQGYQGSCGDCSGQDVAIEKGGVTGYTSVTSQGFNVDAIKAALVQKGPLSIGVGANDSWMSYGGGVFDTSSCSSQSDHAVLLVGYGSESGQDYWIVKNSWGEHWGVNGYIHLAIDQGDTNYCGMDSDVDVSYPTLDVPTPSGGCKSVAHCTTCDASDASRCDPNGCDSNFDFDKSDGSCKKHHGADCNVPHCSTCDSSDPTRCAQDGCKMGFDFIKTDGSCKQHHNPKPDPKPHPKPKPSPDSNKFAAPKIVDPCPANTSLFGMSTESSFGLVCSSTCSSATDCGENAICTKGHCVQVCGGVFGGKCAEGLSCMDGFCLMSADAHGHDDNDSDEPDDDWFSDDEDDYENGQNDFLFPQNSDNVQGFFGGNDKWITEIENIFNMIEKILDMLKNSQPVNGDQSAQADGSHFVSSAQADKVQGWFNPLSWLSDIKMILPLLEKIYDMLKNKQI